MEPRSYDTQLTESVGVAIGHARQLGYQIERMQIDVTVNAGVATVYFHLRPRPDRAVLGGDLKVLIEIGSKRIVDVQRGQ